MRDRAPRLERRAIRLPDGRELIYYPFPGADAPRADAPATAPGAAQPPPPPREER